MVCDECGFSRNIFLGLQKYVLQGILSNQYHMSKKERVWMFMCFMYFEGCFSKPEYETTTDVEMNY